MPILEKLVQSSQACHWTDSIPLEFHYTPGVAGEEFRRELRDHGRLLAARCSKCKNTYVPSRMFCPNCFMEMKEDAPLDGQGYVYSFTTVNRNRSGEATDEPVTIALIKFEGVKGGIVHRLDADNAEKVTFGMKVEPVLKEAKERTGSLTDIISFKPQ